MSLNTVLVTVRCAHQSSPDEKIECHLSWTVRDLKEHLNNVHPTKPDAAKQRLIYSGRLLKNESLLEDVLRLYSDDGQHVIHLVYTPTVERLSRNKEKALAGSSQSSGSESLRQRRNRPSTQQPPVSAASHGNGINASSHPHSTTSPVIAPVFSLNDYMNNAAGFGPSAAHASSGPNSNIAETNLHAADITQSQAAMFQAQQAYAMYMTNYMHYLSQLYGGVSYPVGQFGMMVQPVGMPANSGGGTAQTEATATVATGAQSSDANDGNQGSDSAAVGPAAGNDRQQQPAQQEAANQVMNAQGGLDDEDPRDRDWLDWIYMVTRAGFLFLILYFYSSLERFMVVIAITALIYAYNHGWFGRHIDRIRQANNNNNNNNGEAPAAAADPPEQPNAADAGSSPANDGDSGGGASVANESQTAGESSASNDNATNDAGSSNDESEQQAPASASQQQPAEESLQRGQNSMPYGPDASAWQIFWTTCYTFITSFFISLVPERPPPMAA